MGDETHNIMNLDLNLEPGVNPDDEHGSVLSAETMNLEERLDSPQRLGETLMRHRAARSRPGQRWRSVWRAVPTSRDTRNLSLELMGGIDLEQGEGSATPLFPPLFQGGAALPPPDERLDEETKVYDTNNELLKNEALGNKDDVEKSNGDNGNFFDCNICLDQAREPVVTCCGHLFCWPCLYQWLHLHSDSKECPICKGEVTMKNLTPIYGGGNDKHEGEGESTLKIPQRPQARRIEGWRQTFQRNAFTIPMEEMIRRIGNRFDLSRDMTQVNPHPHHPHPRTSDGTRISPDRSNFVERRNFILNRFMTSRGMRREQNAEDPIDLSQTNPVNSDVVNSDVAERLGVIRRSNPHRASMISNFTSALSSAERLVDTYFRNHPLETVDDRDSVSSIAAVIQSESQTVDTVVEIDSRVSLSTSSSRRRHGVSRMSDVDSGNSRAPRRRRLN